MSGSVSGSRFIAEQGERLWVEHLPAHASELNPVEHVWAYWKQHALPNVCPKDYWELGEGARRTVKRIRRRPRLIRAFWQQVRSRGAFSATQFSDPITGVIMAAQNGLANDDQSLPQQMSTLTTCINTMQTNRPRNLRRPTR